MKEEIKVLLNSINTIRINPIAVCRLPIISNNWELMGKSHGGDVLPPGRDVK